MQIDRIPVLMRRYGRIISVRRGDMSFSAAAYISPMTHRNRDYLEDRYASLGHADQNSFYCVSAVSGDKLYPQMGDFVVDCGETFVVSAAELMRLRDRPLFAWAILRRSTEWEVV